MNKFLNKIRSIENEIPIVNFALLSYKEQCWDFQSCTQYFFVPSVCSFHVPYQTK